MGQNVCCCFGQSEIEETEELKITLRVLIENLIADEGVDSFFFEKDSWFSDVCYDIAASMRQCYPWIGLTRCTETRRGMIQSSRFCLVYYDEDMSVVDETDVRIALEYADIHKKVSYKYRIREKAVSYDGSVVLKESFDFGDKRGFLLFLFLQQTFGSAPI